MRILPVSLNFSIKPNNVSKKPRLINNQAEKYHALPEISQNPQNWNLSFCATKNTQATQSIKEPEKPVSQEKLQNIEQMLASYEKTLYCSRKTYDEFKNTDRTIVSLISSLNLQRMFLQKDKVKSLIHANGTIATIERDKDNNYYYNEGKKKTKNGFTVDKILIYNSDDERIDNYMEGFSINSDESLPYGQKEVKKGITTWQKRERGEYFEERKYAPNILSEKRINKTNTSERIIQFDIRTNKMRSYEENITYISDSDKNSDYTLSERKITYPRKSSTPASYRESVQRYEHDGTESAKRMIEFSADGMPEYYYENWNARKNRHSDKPVITYDFKAKRLKNGTWVVVK